MRPDEQSENRSPPPRWIKLPSQFHSINTSTVSVTAQGSSTTVDPGAELVVAVGAGGVPAASVVEVVAGAVLTVAEASSAPPPPHATKTRASPDTLADVRLRRTALEFLAEAIIERYSFT